MNNKNTIYVVGMGPGSMDLVTPQAKNILLESDVIIGYTVYLDLLRDAFPNHEMVSTPMRREEERCRLCFERALLGQKVSLVCSGDAGIYGMASIMYKIGMEYPEIEIEVIPGITAASSGAAILGAPINHDFCIISLSDLLTPWELIEKRLTVAAQGDFAIVLYNPSSKNRPDYLQRACDILLRYIEGERACGYVENIGREGCVKKVMSLYELRNTAVNMFSTVFIGNSRSHIVDGMLITPRGYRTEDQI